MDIHIMFFTWFMAFFIFSSVFVIKDNRYFLLMAPSVAYFMILGLSIISNSLKFMFKNRDYIPNICHFVDFNYTTYQQLLKYRIYYMQITIKLLQMNKLNSLVNGLLIMIPNIKIKISILIYGPISAGILKQM